LRNSDLTPAVAPRFAAEDAAAALAEVEGVAAEAAAGMWPGVAGLWGAAVFWSEAEVEADEPIMLKGGLNSPVRNFTEIRTLRRSPTRPNT
jgi:hypothetical protein